ncbi:hypothetical protein RYH80_09530 [Halobaculum sp. MBLA0147]|uniref:DUF7268 family protein n=1 Tax=Halobaculum sp. MBLA0147 TaxID=3079934 RepID=UPI0035269526
MSRSDTPVSDPAGSDGGDLPPLRTAVRRRLRLFASGLVVGVPAAPLGVAVFVFGAGRGVVDALAATFAVGSLALGFGVLGWSGSILSGRGIEAAQRHLDTDTDWTERKSRRAMTRICAFGVGVMVGVSVLEAVLA